MKKPRNNAERKELLGSIVQQELTKAEGGESDELQANRTEAMKYYFGTLPAAPTDADGELIEGRSSVVSMDVANTTNAMLAMMREMLILDAELYIEPEGEQDEVLAKAEADICTDVLLKDNPGEKLVLSAIKDGLLLKNGCMKVLMENGECSVYAVPIENVCYTAGWDGKVQDIPFFAETIKYTRSDLVSMGISKSKVYELPASDEFETGTSQSRDATFKQERDGETPDQDEITCREAYVLVDMNGDGISERYRCLIAGDNICLEYEEVPVVPYALGSPFLIPHRLTGESVFDRIRYIQDSNTTMLRQWHDNVAVINNGRYIYDPSRATEADIMTPMAGGGIRASDPSAVVPLMVPDVSMGLMAALDYNRRQRTEAVGAALDMASAEAQLANKAATVASIEKGNQELVSAMVANNFALTLIKGTYQLIHFFLRNYAERPYIARIQGQAVPVQPQMFKGNRRMTVRCGMSPSQKAMQQQALGQHMQLLAQAMMQGMDGVLADPNTLYRTSMRWLKSNGVEDPESLAIDPTSEPAKQQLQSKAEQSQQMQAMQQQIAQLQFQLEQAKLAEEARQHDEEMRFKYFDANLDAELEEAKLTGQGIIDLEKQRLSNEQAERTAQRNTERSNSISGGND